MGTHIVLDLELFLDEIKFGKSVREFSAFINFIEVVVVEAVDVEGLGFGGLLVFDGLLEFVEQFLDEFFRVVGQVVVDLALLDAGGGLLDQEWNVDVLLLLHALHFYGWSGQLI